MPNEFFQYHTVMNFSNHIQYNLLLKIVTVRITSVMETITGKITLYENYEDKKKLLVETNFIKVSSIFITILQK